MLSHAIHRCQLVEYSGAKFAAPVRFIDASLSNVLLSQARNTHSLPVMRDCQMLYRAKFVMPMRFSDECSSETEFVIAVRIACTSISETYETVAALHVSCI